MCHQRHQLKQEKYTSAETGLEFTKWKREVGKKMKAAKEEWIEEQYKNIEKRMMSRNGKRPNSTSQLSSKAAVETT